VRVLKSHYGKYAQAVAIDTNNVAIQAKDNAVIQATPIPSDLSNLSSSFFELENFLETVDEFRSSSPERISVTVPS